MLYIQGILDVGKKYFRFKNNPVRDYMWVEKNKKDKIKIPLGMIFRWNIRYWKKIFQC